MKYLLNTNTLLRILLSAVFMLLFHFVTAQNNKEKPTRYALEATTEYWKDTLLANPQIKKNKKLVLDIQNLAKKRMDEADDDTKIKTVEEYVAIFTVNWDAIDKQQKPKFKDKYSELSKNKENIQKIIKSDVIRQKLQDTALKTETIKEDDKNDKNTEKDKEKDNEKDKEKDDKTSGSSVPVLLWVFVVLAIGSSVAVYFVLQKKNKQTAEKIAKNIVKKEVENVDRKYENKFKNTPVQNSSTDTKQIESEIQKIKFDLESIRSEIAVQKSHTPVSNKTYSETYYFGTASIEEGYLHDTYKKSYDGNMCYVIHTDGKEGIIDIVHDNKFLIIKYQDKILKPGIAEKIGWKEDDNNTFSRSEPGKVELQGNKWVITEKVKVYFNE